MIDPERVTTSSYKVLALYGDPPMYAVTTYPQYNEIRSVNDVIGGTYRIDLLPQWMLTGITMLDLSCNDRVQGEIEGFGYKTGAVYWFFARQVYDARNAQPTTKENNDS